MRSGCPGCGGAARGGAERRWARLRSVEYAAAVAGRGGEEEGVEPVDERRVGQDVVVQVQHRLRDGGAREGAWVRRGRERDGGSTEEE